VTTAPARVALVVAILACASSAEADPVFLFGANYGAPTKMSGTAGVLIPLGRQEPSSVQPSITRTGAIVEGAFGRGGQRIAAGWSARMTEGSLLLTYGLDFCGTVTRTSGTPRGASADSTYAGFVAGFNVSAARMTAGVEHRVSGPSGPHATIFTWTLGVQVPIGW
jgi:hypothetical protein